MSPQRRSGPHRNLHCHRQHAAADQGQEQRQRPRFSQTYPHTTQLPGADGGEQVVKVALKMKMEIMK